MRLNRERSKYIKQNTYRNNPSLKQGDDNLAETNACARAVPEINVTRTKKDRVTNHRLIWDQENRVYTQQNENEIKQKGTTILDKAKWMIFRSPTVQKTANIIYKKTGKMLRKAHENIRENECQGRVPPKGPYGSTCPKCGLLLIEALWQFADDHPRKICPSGCHKDNQAWMRWTYYEPECHVAYLTENVDGNVDGTRTRLPIPDYSVFNHKMGPPVTVDSWLDNDHMENIITSDRVSLLQGTQEHVQEGLTSGLYKLDQSRGYSALDKSKTPLNVTKSRESVGRSRRKDATKSVRRSRSDVTRGNRSKTEIERRKIERDSSTVQKSQSKSNKKRSRDPYLTSHHPTDGARRTARTRSDRVKPPFRRETNDTIDNIDELLLTGGSAKTSGPSERVYTRNGLTPQDYRAISMKNESGYLASDRRLGDAASCERCDDSGDDLLCFQPVSKSSKYRRNNKQTSKMRYLEKEELDCQTETEIETLNSLRRSPWSKPYHKLNKLNDDEQMRTKTSVLSRAINQE